MGYTANKMRIEWNEIHVVDRSHPPIFTTKQVKSKSGLYKKGLVCTEADGVISGYISGSDTQPICVVTDTVDSANDTVVNVLQHGVAYFEAIFDANGNQLSSDDLIKLSDSAIFIS
jgi:hypothetical protein